MVWNQPPKKSVNPACASAMTFVKPSHGDNPNSETPQIVTRSTYDPRPLQHTVPLSLNLTLARVCRCSRSQILPGNSRVTREHTTNRSS